MHTPGSFCDVAFRYAVWLRETRQWDAMDLFTWVIHPAVGMLAGRNKTHITDLDATIVRRAIRVAIQDGIEPELAAGAWLDFIAFLDAEGIAHGPLLEGLTLVS